VGTEKNKELRQFQRKPFRAVLAGLASGGAGHRICSSRPPASHSGIDCRGRGSTEVGGVGRQGRTGRCPSQPNRRRLQFGGPIHAGSDAIPVAVIRAEGNSAQGLSSAEGQGPMVTGGVMATEVLLGNGMRTPPRDLGVGTEAGKSTAGASGKIMLTPQPAATSATGTLSRGMLTPLEAATVEGVDTLEEELRFTHVSFPCFTMTSC
jgi:hypothetical protein